MSGGQLLTYLDRLAGDRAGALGPGRMEIVDVTPGAPAFRTRDDPDGHRAFASAGEHTTVVRTG